MMKTKWSKRRRVLCIIAITGLAYYVFCVPNRELAPYLNSLGRAKTITVWEGLPHHYYDPDLLKSELATKKTVHHHDVPFYASTQTLNPDEAFRTRWILTWPSTYLERRKDVMTVKTCGGYHPDYAIEWNDSGGAYQIHLCFGCWEVKLYGPNGEPHYDLSNSSRDQLKAIFKPYRQQLPKGRFE